MLKYIFILLFLTLNVNALEICGTLEQAGFVIVDGKELIAFDRDADLSQTINDIEINLQKKDWDIQNITGVPQKTVTPSKKDSQAIAFESNLVKEAYAKKVDKEYWREGFIAPLEGRISGKYGGQRVYNGTPKNPHLGVDIARPEGTPIIASGSGVVALASPEMFYNGHLIMINHGDELRTLYAHLSKLNVKEGDVVKKGDVIGFVGTTGRSTGPHLHFGVNFNGIKFNPKNLYTMFENCNSY
ncbi:MAG: M23 family metallopeptidase [Alphaproteobacteria bacterium]